MKWRTLSQRPKNGSPPPVWDTFLFTFSQIGAPNLGSAERGHPAICSDLFRFPRFLPICSDLRSMFSGIPRFVPICSDLLRFLPICSDLFSEQIRTDQGNPFLPTPLQIPDQKNPPLHKTNMTGRPGYRTMDMNGGSSAPYLACILCVPLFVHCLIGVEAEMLLDYQGRAGIISIVRWNLRPVIFGVDLCQTLG